MRLSRDKIQRMINAGGGSSSGGGGGSDIAGGATQAWVNMNYVSIEFFRKVFKVWAAGETSSDPDVEIMPNDIASTVKNIQAQAGLWTEAFLSALGQGSGGGTGGATTLDQLDDVVITSPTNGQALIYNATSQMWVNGTIQSGTDMATVWSALAAATNEQINASHLSGVLADYVTTTSLQTILGDYLTQTSADQRYITIAYFDRLFRAYNGSTLVSHNDTTSTIDNIKAMFGFWTDMYLSALGRNSAATGLGIDNLTDVTINTPTDGQVLQYNATSSKWENATLNIQTVTALANLTDVLLTNVEQNQVLIYNSNSATWVNTTLKTINNQSLIGSGDISVGGGASGNYLPLTGGTVTGTGITISRSGYALRHLIFKNGESFDGYGNFQFGSSNVYSTWSVMNYDRSRNILTVSQGDNNVTINSNNDRYLKLYGTTSRWVLIGFDSIDHYFGYEKNWNEFYFSNSVRFDYLPKVLYGDILIDAYSKGNDHGIYLRNLANSPYNCSIFCYDHRDYGQSPDGISINGYDGVSICTGSNTRQERMRIAENGRVGIGTTSPSYNLHVSGDIYATGAITALSDARKKDITGEAVVSVEQIAHAPAVQFLWKDKERRKDGQQVGTLAQYWQTVLPEVVMDKGGELSMQYGVAALVSAITIAKKVVNHEQRITELEKENEELKKQLNAA